MGDENIYIEIAGVIGGLSIGALAIIAIFANEYIWVSGPVVGALTILGIALAYFHSKENRD